MSLGDRVFQRYLVLPLVQSGYVMFRTLLWEECIECLSSFSLSVEEWPLSIDKYVLYLHKLTVHCPLLFDTVDSNMSLLNKGTNFLPVFSYLFPFETDAILLNLYLRAIMEGNVRRDKSVIMYWIAVHHIAACVFGGTDSSESKPILDAKVFQRL